MDNVDPKLNYLIVKITPAVEDLVGSEATPAAIVPLDTHFFEWMEERRALVRAAYDFHLAVAVFHRIINFADIDVFDPESYSPDGEEDIEDTKKLQAMLKPIWDALKDDQFAVVSGQTIQDCGLDPFEEVEDFITGNEYFGLSMSPVFEKEPVLVFELEVELKHSYEPWDTVHINFEDLKKYKSVEQG